MSTVLFASRLRARHSECNALERLVAGARAGRSGVLVLCGEAGVGKSALLNHVPRQASTIADRVLALAKTSRLQRPVRLGVDLAVRTW